MLNFYHSDRMATVLKDVEMSSLDTRKNDLSRTGYTLTQNYNACPVRSQHLEVNKKELLTDSA